MDPNIEAILSGQPAAPAATPATPISTPPAPDAGKQDAPAPGQAGAQPAPTATPASAAPITGQAPPAISDEQLLNAAGLTESPEKKLGRLERDYSASSKEARRKDDRLKALEVLLKDQGTDVADDEKGIPVGLIANKKYSKDMPGLDIKVKDLPDEIQAEFESDQQKVVDFIVDKAKKALTRVTPTLDRTAAPLSPERHETAVQYLADMKWETGDAKFPGLAANRKVIEQMINLPSGSKALKEFYNQEPEMALALLNLQIDHARAHIIEQGIKAVKAIEDKRKAAETNPQPLPGGGGVASMGREADDMASQIAHARLGY